MNLLERLVDAGLRVEAAPNWETNTNGGRDRTETAGIVCHWDGIRGDLDLGYYYHRKKDAWPYHIAIGRDDTVYLISQRYTWHAGLGDSDLVDVARAGGPVPDDQSTKNDTNGNPHFFSVAINYHPDEGPVPQYDTLVIVNQVLVEHFDLGVGQVFRHMDWTQRKSDISTISLEQFRVDIEEGLTMPLTDADIDRIWAKFAVSDTSSGEPITVLKQLQRISSNVEGLRHAELDGFDDDELQEIADAVNDELARRLSGQGGPV